MFLQVPINITNTIPLNDLSKYMTFKYTGRIERTIYTINIHTEREDKNAQLTPLIVNKIFRFEPATVRGFKH